MPRWRAAPRWWWRVARLTPVAALGLTVLWAVSGGETPVVLVVEAPSEGDAAPRVLPDGTPVWVLTSADGEVTVLEAFTPGAGPIGGVVGWCTTAGRLVDPHLGLSFSPDGDRYRGSVPARLPPAADTTLALTPRDAEMAGQQPTGMPGPSSTGRAGLVLDMTAGDRTTAGTPVRVGMARPPQVEAVDPRLGGELAHGPPIGCRLPERRLVMRDDPGDLSAMIDHRAFTGRVDPDREGWQVADGWIRVAPDGTVTWCDGSMRGRTGEACDDRRGVPVSLRVDDVAAGGVVTAIGSPLAIRVEAGSVAAAAVLPSSAWAGSSLVATEVHSMHLLGRDARGSRLLVRAEPDERRCVSVAPPMSGAPPGTDGVYIDTDTRVDLTGIDAMEEIGAIADGQPGRDVEIVVDLQTCRTLLVSDPG